MTPEQFADAVLEHLFVHGFNCHNPSLIPLFAHAQRQPDGDWPDIATFAAFSIQTGIAQQAVTEEKMASPTAGASERWLAVHEAGHAIVGVRSGLILRGIRFYGDGGPPGEAGFESFNWRTSTDEVLLRRHIRVDVAANLAELMLAVREPEGGIPSQFFLRKRPAPDEKYATDVIGAWKAARRLATVLGGEFDSESDDRLWAASHEIIRQEEDEADRILRDEIVALRCLADTLQGGPMTGTQVRAIIEG